MTLLIFGILLYWFFLFVSKPVNDEQNVTRGKNQPQKRLLKPLLNAHEVLSAQVFRAYFFAALLVDVFLILFLSLLYPILQDVYLLIALNQGKVFLLIGANVVVFIALLYNLYTHYRSADLTVAARVFFRALVVHTAALLLFGLLRYHDVWCLEANFKLEIILAIGLVLVVLLDVVGYPKFLKTKLQGKPFFKHWFTPMWTSVAFLTVLQGLFILGI